MAETLGSSLGPIQVSPRRLYKSWSEENAAKAAIQGFQGFSSSSEWIKSCSTIASAPQIRQDSTGDRNETCFCGRSPISFSHAARQPRKGMEWRMQIRDGTHKMCSTGTKRSEGMTQSLAMCERGIAATRQDHRLRSFRLKNAVMGTIYKARLCRENLTIKGSKHHAQAFGEVCLIQLYRREEFLKKIQQEEATSPEVCASMVQLLGTSWSKKAAFFSFLIKGMKWASPVRLLSKNIPIRLQLTTCFSLHSAATRRGVHWFSSFASMSASLSTSRSTTSRGHIRVTLVLYLCMKVGPLCNSFLTF